MLDEELQGAEVAERRWDIKEFYNITEKLSKRSFRRYNPVKNNNEVF